MRATRFTSAGLTVLTAVCAVSAALAQEVHFSPEERLDGIDVALIGTARSSIDLASCALTDPIVLDALNDAERRGVVIRVVLDPREHHDFVRLGDLADNAILTVPQGCGGRHRNRDGTGEGAWRMARRWRLALPRVWSCAREGENTAPGELSRERRDEIHDARRKGFRQPHVTSERRRLR